jgi:hypothetical protein
MSSKVNLYKLMIESSDCTFSFSMDMEELLLI